MANRSGGQRTGPYKLPLLSASQLGQTKCWARWAFDRLLKEKEPTDEKMQLGTDRHAEMEAWNDHAIMPKSKAALKAMLCAPAPGIAVAESTVRFDTPGTPWIGFIDLAYSWRGPLPGEPSIQRWVGGPAPLMDTDHIIIHDWKFTGNLKNAKTAEELANDPASNIYGYEAYLGGAKRVSGRWVYQDFAGKQSPKQVWFDLTKDRVEDNMAKLDALGAKIQEVYRQRPSVTDLPYDTSQCFAFGKPCPRLNDPRCPRNAKPETNTGFGFGKKKQVSYDNVKNNLNARFGGTPPALPGKTAGGPPPLPGRPVTPPPLPGRSGTPALPGKPAGGPPPLPSKSAEDSEAQRSAEEYLKAQGKDPGLVTRPINQPESGFINPTGGPSVAADSPEMAAEQQGIGKAQERAPDDLDAIQDRDQLKAMAVSMGACEPGSRMQAKSLRDAIRTKRMEQGLNTKQVDMFPAAEPDATQQLQAKVSEALSEAIENTPKVDMGKLEKDFLDHVTSFYLYVNCTPEDEEYTDLPSLLPLLNQQLGVKDYRHIQYTGSADLCTVAREVIPNLEPDIKHLRVNTMTPEGQVLVNTLRDMAYKTVSA